jgi:hypothetical protein
MFHLNIIRKPRQEIYNKSKQQFAEIIELLENGIDLVVKCTEILQPEGDVTDRNTPDGASKFAVWRFVSTLPISATWCLDTALCGDYSISKNILRLSLEETIKLSYYSAFPDSALKQITRSRNNDEISIPKMLDQLELDHRKGILSLYGDISNFYSHANLNLPSELVYDEGGKISIGGGSRFIPSTFEAIVFQLIILIGNALKFVTFRYEILLKNDDWMKTFRFFLEEGDKLVNSNKGESR